MTSELTDEEKKDLRDTAFLLALRRVIEAERMSFLMDKARELARNMEDSEYTVLARTINGANCDVPNEAYEFALALGIIPEDTEYLNDNDYDRLQAKLRGVDLKDFVRESPLETLKRLGVRLTPLGDEKDGD